MREDGGLARILHQYDYQAPLMRKSVQLPNHPRMVMVSPAKAIMIFPVRSHPAEPPAPRPAARVARGHRCCCLLFTLALFLSTSLPVILVPSVIDKEIPYENSPHLVISSLDLDRIEQLLGNHPSTLPCKRSWIAPRSANPPTCRRTW